MFASWSNLVLVITIFKALHHHVIARTNTLHRQAVFKDKVYYVLEPFESNDGFSTQLYGDQGSLSLLSERHQHLHGDGALRVEYEAVATENWGGFVAFRLLAPSEELYYNCHNASDIVMNYKVVEGQSNPGRAHLRLILFDGGTSCRDSGCENHIDMEHYYSFNHILDKEDDDDDVLNGWKEIRIPLRGSLNESSPFWNPGWEGVVGNSRLDSETLKGFKVEFNIDNVGGIGSNTSGVILLDQLRCEGGPGLFGSAFYSGNRPNTEMSDVADWTEGYTSPLSEELSQYILQSPKGHIVMNYTLEQVDGGGRNDVTHLSVGRSYYNLSHSNVIRLAYDIIEQAEPPHRASISLVLLGGAFEASQDFIEYGSLKYMLNGSGVGSSDALSLTKLIEISLDEEDIIFDASYVRGYRIQLDIDDEGETGSVVDGIVAIGNLTAFSDSSDILGDQTEVNGGIAAGIKCVKESVLSFNPSSSVFSDRQFIITGSKCCEECLNDDDCLFSMSHTPMSYAPVCKLADKLDINSMDLANTRSKAKDTSVYWVDDPSKRGDYCILCNCDEGQLLIDCRSKGLKIVPSIFKEANGWSPKILDLRQNPELLMIGADSFASIAHSLEEIRLPLNLTHLSYEAVNNLSNLDRVLFESSEAHDVNGISMANVNNLNNAIAHKSDFFGDYLCCGLSKSKHINLSMPADGLTFCDMAVDAVGDDTIYMPFIEYFRASVVSEITESSDFMSEAAKSPQACSEYCQLVSGCNFFAYDQRWKEAEHTCFMLADKGEMQEICCDEDDHGDRDMLTPGWTSGIPPHSRKDAVIVANPRELSLNEDNGYAANFDLSLRVNPLRGSVVVTPSLNLVRQSLNIIITPPRIVLYDNTTKASVKVSVSGARSISEKQILILDLNVSACDSAFTIISSARKSSLYIDVNPPRLAVNQSTIVSLSVISILSVIAGIAVYLAIRRRREKADVAWMIDPSDLTYSTPPEIIGSGTFGLVLLATYRGTDVAVKRVLPERQTSNGSYPSSRTISSQTISSRTISNEDQKLSTTEILPIHYDNGKLSSTNSTLRLGRAQMWVSSVVKASGSKSGEKELSRLREDFITEIRLLSQLRHPCIITVMGAVLEKGHEPLLVMEQMAYGSLYDVVRNDTMPLEGDFLLSVLSDVSQGMRFLHESSPPIVHGDLKASNILVSSSLHAKIADFGLSQKSKLGIVG